MSRSDFWKMTHMKTFNFGLSLRFCSGFMFRNFLYIMVFTYYYKNIRGNHCSIKLNKNITKRKFPTNDASIEYSNVKLGDIIYTTIDVYYVPWVLGHVLEQLKKESNKM